MNGITKITFLGIIILLIISGSFYHTSDQVITAKVTDKGRISMGSGEDLRHMYLVYTDKETFRNEDELFWDKFNSSDVQGQLKVDSTYTFKVIGWRIPFLSTYRNIIEYK